MPRFEYAVLGAGAMGSIVAAHLARAGHAVAVLARGARAAQVRAAGLRIRGLAEFAQPVEVIDAPERLHGAEVLVVATKARGTAASLEPLRGAGIGVALSIQNGVMKNELLAQAFGAGRVLGALADTSGELLGSGEVLFTRNVRLLVGEPAGGITPRAQRVARDLESAGVHAAAVPDIGTHEWSKFAAWVGLFGVTITTRVATWKYLSDPGAARVLVRLVRETGALARACGIELTDESMMPVATLCSVPEDEAVRIIQRAGADYRARAPDHRLSALQDLEAGRPLEVDETLGAAARRAAELNLSLPLLASFCHLAAAIDRTRRS